MVVCELFCPIKEILSPASNVRSGILFARLELDVDDGLFTRLQLLSPKQLTTGYNAQVTDRSQRGSQEVAKWRSFPKCKVTWSRRVGHVV
jgi:hypothetical protein